MTALEIEIVEKIHSLRAKQRKLSCQESECARRIQQLIREQTEIEDDITALEFSRSELHAATLKQSEEAWRLKKILGDLI